MPFSTFSAPVREVISYIETGPFLRPCRVHEVNGVNFVTRLEEADWWSRQQEYAPVWEDVKQHYGGANLGREYALEPRPELRKRIDEHYDSLARLVESKLDPTFRDFAGVVVGDLAECASNRSVNGISDTFYEKIFEAYKHGLWPCGWRGGDYPKGEMIAFLPSRECPGAEPTTREYREWLNKERLRKERGELSLLERTNRVIEKVCADLGAGYLGYHTACVGIVVDGMARVATCQDDDRIEAGEGASCIHFHTSIGQYDMYITNGGTLVYDSQGMQVLSYPEMTTDAVFGASADT